LDQINKDDFYILTGSDNFLLQQCQKVSQSDNGVLLYNGKIELKEKGQAEVCNWRN
jgi:hypothetical protein